MIISSIVAVARNNVIGKNNNIPWYLPADLKYFKKTTMGHHILMGRKSYQSIGRPLPGRTNIIITTDPYFISSNCLIAGSIYEGLEMAYDNGEEECFIIGGGKIYEQTAELWDKLYITSVDIEVQGDVYFPELDLTQWTLVSQKDMSPDEKNPYHYSFKVYQR